MTPTDAGRGRRKILALLIVLAIFIGLPLWQFLQPEDIPPTRAGVLVELELVVPEVFEDILRYPGTITPENTTVVTPKLAGEVLRMHVRSNDQVQAGQLLAELDDSLPRLQAEQARAGVRAAQAQLDQARRGVRAQELESARASVEQAEEDLQTARSNLERTERLYEAGTIPRARYEEAQNSFRSARTQVENARRSLRLMEEGASAEELELAEANLESARKQLQLAELQLGYAEVRAPIAGRVADVMVEEGNMVSTETALAAIIGDELIHVQSALPEEHYGTLGFLAGELEARIFPIAYPDDPPYEGVLSHVSSVIQPESRTFKIEVAVDNTRGRLRPGMFVNMELIVRRIEDAIVVPGSAVLRRDGRSVVFTVEEVEGETVARMLPVRVGARSTGRLLIAEGLEADIPIVVRGNTYLEDGQLVRVVEGDRP
ncbi:efflux RND transporter periplasmic adaptor subunit [Spirochaeta africana]|uniref:RND family efflux transporter, MFP subunit n=1 Tax=Spirochaeta africana (strain ATCC 700263 / DSM 8902 / Z-7692) TaxID=889378 RepID=H9UFB2_SPIAZ|nr:efflux RND transporter periplasmic adaptor subunit [Spirochaeta africana]AFG36205.1 RND family efflux transporter, MFP subunit [Spirochaeta africana DSM 8902]